MKLHFGYKCSETQNPRTFFHTYFQKIANYIRKSQNSHFSKFKISNLYYRYLPNFLSVYFPMSEVNKKFNLKLYDAILALSKNKRAFFGFFRPLKVKFSR